MEEAYNQAQRHWIDNMINACRDYERHEEERSDFVRGQWLKYVGICVAVDEASAEVYIISCYVYNTRVYIYNVRIPTIVCDYMCIMICA